MSRFNILDHFIFYGNLFELKVKGLSVYHEIDNTSEPLLLELSFKFDRLSFVRRQFVAKAASHRASPADFDNYRETLNAQLRTIRVPVDAVLCRNVLCRDCAHIASLNEFVCCILMLVWLQQR